MSQMVVVEKDADGYYAWCPEVKGCQPQGQTVGESLANIREAIGLYLETLTELERPFVISIPPAAARGRGSDRISARRPRRRSRAESVTGD